MSASRSRISRALPYALPVMAGYVAIGIPCGILEAEVGVAPWMALLLSATFYTGAGQFMLSNLWLAGQAILPIAASISFVNLRQLLYSAAFAPRLKGTRKGLAALFALTVTDESFGVNMDRFAQSDAARASADASEGDGSDTAASPSASTWDPADATVLNLLCMSAWALANFAGALVGDALAIPTAVASFAMTAIFICLLFGRDFTATTIVVAAVSAGGVVLCKAIGWDQPAIIVGAVLGVAAGAVFNLRAHDRPVVPETPAEVEWTERVYGEPMMSEEVLSEAEFEVAGESAPEAQWQNVANRERERVHP